MNILILSTSDQGGAANACIRLHQGLLAIGQNSKMLVLKKTRKDIDEVHRFLSIYEPRSLPKRIKKAPRVIQFNNKMAQKRQNRPTEEMFSFFETLHDVTSHPLYEWADVINIHWVSNYLDYPSFFQKNTKPVIWTLHDMLLFTGGYHYEKGFPFTAYQDLIAENYQLKKKIFANEAFTVVSPSKWLYNHAKAAQAIYPKAVHQWIPYGIKTEIFKPYEKAFARAVFNLPKGKKIVLFVAASVDGNRKGIKHLLGALDLLGEEDLGLAVMGANVEKLNLDPAKTYPLGYISDPRLVALAYAAADVFVIPSIEDNLPNTVIESLCCATPVVGFDIGGIPDMVLSGQNGEVCPKINASSLAKSIKKVLNTDYDSDWIRQNAVERYGLEVQAKTYLELFEKALSSAKEA